MPSRLPIRRWGAQVVVLLLAAVVAWWVLAHRTGGRVDGDPVSRAAGKETVVPAPIRLEPVLRGSRVAVSAPSPARAGSDPEPTTWQLSFEVVGPGGAPLPWTRLAVQGAGGRFSQWSSAAAGATTGRVEVVGEGRLHVWAVDSLPWQSDRLTIPESGQRHVLIRPDPGLIVSGLVFQADGSTPVPEGIVEVHPGTRVRSAIHARLHAISGAVRDGRFLVRGVPPGPVRVRARVPTLVLGGETSVEARAGDEDVRLVLPARGEITFLVVDEATGLAPDAVYVRIVRIEGDMEWPETFVRPAGSIDGEATRSVGSFPAMPGNTRLFRVRVPGYEPSDVLEAVVPECGGLVTVRVELRPDPGSAARVRLRLVADGAPLPRWMRVRELDDVGTELSYEVDGGVVTLDLEPGEHHLIAADTIPPRETGPYWLPAELNVALEPGEVHEIAVPLRQGGWVFVPGDLDPAPDEVRWLCGEDTRETEALFHVHGGRTGFFLGLLPPGRWTLWLGAGKGARTAEIDVRAGAVVRLEATALRVVGEER